MSKPGVNARTAHSFADIDNMPKQLRACVHEFGYSTVAVLVKHGIKNPAHIREIIAEVWAGPRSAMQHSSIPQGLRAVEWLMNEAECNVPLKTIMRTLHSGGYMIMPRGASRSMLDASMSAVSGGNVVVTKIEKHRRRWMASFDAYCREMFGEIEKLA